MREAQTGSASQGLQSLPPALPIAPGDRVRHPAHEHTRPAMCPVERQSRARLRLRRSLVRHFLQLLSDGTLVLTGLVAPISLASRREVIPPDIVEVLEISFVETTARAPGLKLIRLKVHAAQGAAGGSNDGRRTIQDVGAEASNALSEFTHNVDHSRVTMREHVFDLSGGLCQVVARLHAASCCADPWLIGKQLMAACGYASTFMGSAFKRHHSPCWRELVEGNGRGLYRLNLQAPLGRRM